MTVPMLLLACGGGTDDNGTGAPDTGDTEPAPYVTAEADPPAPTGGTDEVQARLQEAIDGYLGITAVPLIAAYDDLAQDQEASCPTYYTSPDGYDYWYDQCTTAGGTSYTGYGIEVVTVQVDPKSGVEQTTTQVFGVGSLSSGGRTLDLSGGGGLQITIDPVSGGSSRYSVVDGSFTHEGPATNSWLDDPSRGPALEIYAAQLGTARTLYYNGGVIEADGSAVLFDAFTVANADTGWLCPTEPSGQASVRNDAGEWIDVVFDADASGATSEGLCDGCGAAWFKGELVGEVCVEVGAVLEWGTAPF